MEFSFQLYSARNYPPLDNVLALLARLGYTQVEGFGGLYQDPAALAASLKKNGLSMPSGHFGLDMLKTPEKAMAVASALGVKHIICPHIGADQRPTDSKGWTEFGQMLGKIAEPFQKAGYGFGWHNHDFEFVPTSDGKLPMDLILDAAPGIGFEADVAWIARGKADPAAYVKKVGSRVMAVHVKDIAPAGENANEDGWADVGYGLMGWNTLIKAIKATTSAKLFVMEHDNPSDLERFASRSLATAQKWA